MNNKEILLVAEAVSNEKGVPKEVIFQALESALSSATKKTFERDVEIRIEIDRKTGNYQTYRRWEVVADDGVDAPTRQITISAAQIEEPELELGAWVEELIDNVPFARIGAQTAKQVIFQKVREAERAIVADEYRLRVGELISGNVKKVDRGNIYVDLGNNVEALIPREFAIPREISRTGDRVRAYLQEIRSEGRGPQIILSRIAPEFLMALFHIEVPEINQGSIEVMGAARDPGRRAKIAVKSHDQRIDPQGACIGMRGSRVSSVRNELNGENVDIVLWDENPAQFVINAMSPAEVVSIVVDEDRHAMEIAVTEEKLAQAIGSGGQNVRLASELTGWTLNIMTEAEANAKTGEEESRTRLNFIEHLGVDDDIADILVREGFATVEEVAYVPATEMLEIEEFDEELVDTLKAAARDVLLAREIARQELGEKAPEPALLELSGMGEDLALALAKQGIYTVEGLAELAVDELSEMGQVDEVRAGELIMAARASWFEQE